jgi:hypothetical protein
MEISTERPIWAELTPMLRQNTKTGEVSLACILCDVEAHRGGEDEARLIADALKSKEPPQGS